MQSMMCLAIRLLYNNYLLVPVGSIEYYNEQQGLKSSSTYHASPNSLQ